MTKRSPRGLFAFERRNDTETAAQSVNGFIAAVEAWANRILAEAEIKVAPRRAWKVASAREHADVVHFALLAAGKANELRASLDIAATKGEETSTQALWCAFRMMQFCGAAYAGATVANENPLSAGIGNIDGGKKGGEASRKVTPDIHKDIKRVMAAVPLGQRGAEKSRLARKWRVSKRTVERIASEK